MSLKLAKVARPAILLFVVAVLIGCTRPEAQGRLVEYRTGEPIADATIIVSRRGWGLSGGQLVWDRDYRASGRTDVEGRFRVPLAGPGWLTGGASLSAEAHGFQRLSEVPVERGVALTLQTVPAVRQPVPGGLAHLGMLADAAPFGWSFIDDRAVTDLGRAGVYPLSIRMSPLDVVLAAPAGGGLAFLPSAEQNIRAPSYGRFLRYIETAPAAGYRPTLRLTGESPGTVFVRTRYGRFAKLAFEPRGLVTGGSLPGASQPVQAGIFLPFAYNALPGRA